MRLSKFGISLTAAVAAMAFASCGGLTGEADEDEATDDEIASSMGADGGASYAIVEDLADATGDEALAASAAASRAAASAKATIEIVAGSRTLSVTYFDQYGGAGEIVGTTPGAVPAGALSAVIESEKAYSVRSANREGTTTVSYTAIIDDIASTLGTWTLDGSFGMERSMALASGSTVESAITHSLDWELSASDGTIESGGTATTVATVSVNGRAARERTYTWAFLGDGTATLTTARGATVTVTVE